MFANPRHIPDDMESNDDDEDEHFEGDDGIMEFDGLMNMEQNDLPMGAIVGSDDTINSSTPMERVFAQLVNTMQEFTNECKESDMTLCEHATSHMRILACNIRNICVATLTSSSQPRQGVGRWRAKKKTPEFLERNFRGQNSLLQGILYIIGKILKRRCLKWSYITHLDIFNTSYGQKNGRESNWQFDS
jgi:hypothetical protein